MNTNLEFILKLRETLSGGLQKLGATAQKSFALVDSSIKRTDGNVARAANSVDQLNKKLDMLKKTRAATIDISQIKAANREIQSIEARIKSMETMGTTTGNGRSGFIGGLGRRAAGMAMLVGATGLAAATGGVVKAAQYGLEGSQQKASFQVLGGQQPGGQLYNDLTGFAQKTIFGNEVYGNAQTMMAFGASVKEVMPDLKMLGDISMGNKERFQSLTLAFSQTRAAGKLMGQDLLQYVNAGFNPLQVMSEKTGKSMAKLRQEMSDGKISFTQVKQAFKDATSEGGKFYRMTDKIAETPFGKFEAFKGQLQGVGLQAGTAMLPMLSKVVDKMSGALTNFSEKSLPALMPKLEKVLNTGMEFIPDIKNLTSSVFGMARPVLNLLGSAPLKDLGHNIMTLTTSLIEGLTPAVEKATWIFEQLVDKGINPILKLFTGDASKEVNQLYGTDQYGYGLTPEGVQQLYKYQAFIKDQQRQGALVTAASSRAIANAIPGTAAYLFGNSGGKALPFMTNPSLPGFKGSYADGSTPGGLTGAQAAGITDTAGKINSGGPHIINITMDAMVKGTTYYVQGTKEAVDNTDRMTGDSLLRLLDSLGTTKGD